MPVPQLQQAEQRAGADTPPRKNRPRMREARVDVGPAGDDQPGEDRGLGQRNARVLDDRAGDDPTRLGRRGRAPGRTGAVGTSLAHPLRGSRGPGRIDVDRGRAQAQRRPATAARLEAGHVLKPTARALHGSTAPCDSLAEAAHPLLDVRLHLDAGLVVFVGQLPRLLAADDLGDRLGDVQAPRPLIPTVRTTTLPSALISISISSSFIADILRRRFVESVQPVRTLMWIAWSSPTRSSRIVICRSFSSLTSR